MPNITVYLDDTTYVRFLNLPDNRRTELRKNIGDHIKEVVQDGNKGVKTS